MPKLLAIDQDAHAIRYLLASVAKGRVRVVACGEIAIEANEDDASPNLAKLLAEELSRVGARGARTLATIRRSDIEVFRLTFPPSQDEELPALVQAQILGRSAALGEEPIVDFVPLNHVQDGEREVEAMAASAETVASYQALASESGLQLKRLIPRPIATAMLFRRLPLENPPATALVVNVLGSEADLLIVAENKIRFSRTVQLGSGEAAASAEALVGEIVRTLTIAPNQLLEDQQISQIILLGNHEEHAKLQQTLSERLPLDVALADPFATDGVSVKDLQEKPDWAAPLLGMLLDEAANERPTIDLLDVRQPPKPRDLRRLIVYGAGALALLIAATTVWASQEQAKIASENEKLSHQLDQLRKEAKSSAKLVAVSKSIEAWNAGSIVWLDELRDLSLKFPPASDIKIRGMSISPLRSSGAAMIRINGTVRDPTVVVQLDHNLRDAHRNSTSTNLREQSDKEGSQPSWRFETVVTTKAWTPEQYRKALAAARKAGILFRTHAQKPSTSAKPSDTTSTEQP